GDRLEHPIAVRCIRAGLRRAARTALPGGSPRRPVGQRDLDRLPRHGRVERDLAVPRENSEDFVQHRVLRSSLRRSHLSRNLLFELNEIILAIITSSLCRKVKINLFEADFDGMESRSAPAI